MADISDPRFFVAGTRFPAALDAAVYHDIGVRATRRNEIDAFRVYRHVFAFGRLYEGNVRATTPALCHP